MFPPERVRVPGILENDLDDVPPIGRKFAEFRRAGFESTRWQRSTHVPLIFPGPGVRQTGVARRQAVGLVDPYPAIF